MDVRQIEYAPHPSNLRSRRVVQVFIWVAVVFLLLPVGIKGGPMGWRQMQLLYWKRKAMSYSPASTEVVFDTKRTISVSATPWIRYWELCSPPGRAGNPTLFLHERRNSRGESRLVAIEAFYGFHVARGESVTCLISNVVNFGQGVSSPTEASESSIREIVHNEPIRCFAGQCDPADASHFMITYEVDSGRFTIDGWLRDDDTIAIDVRRAK